MHVSKHATCVNEWFLLGRPNRVRLCSEDRVGRFRFHRGLALFVIVTSSQNCVYNLAVCKMLNADCLPFMGAALAVSRPRYFRLYAMSAALSASSTDDGFAIVSHLATSVAAAVRGEASIVGVAVSGGAARL